MKTTAKVRPLQEDDLTRVAELERATFADPWSRRSLAESLRQDHVRALVVENEDGCVVGYGMAAVIADEGEILNLAVERAVQGQGLGRLVLEGLLDVLREAGVRKAFLEVRRSNEAAIGLYRAAGFQPLGLRPSYYVSPKEDALTMALELASHDARKR